MRASWVRAAAAAVLFGALAAAAAANLGHRWDEAVTHWVQRAAPALDLPAVLFVFLGNAEVMIGAVCLAGLAAYRRDRPHGLAVFGVAAGLIVLSLLAVALKHLIPHPGPPLSLERRIAHLGVSGATTFSFPSGHALRATFLAGTLLRRRPAAAVAFVGLMIACLIYLGDHWASDTLGALVLGWAAVEAAWAVWLSHQLR